MVKRLDRKSPFDSKKYKVNPIEELLDPKKTKLRDLKKTEGYMYQSREFRIYAPNADDFRRMIKQCSTPLRMSDITASQYCTAEAVYHVRFAENKRFSRVFTYCKINNMRCIHPKESTLKVIAFLEQYNEVLEKETALETSRVERLENIVVDTVPNEEIDEYVEEDCEEFEAGLDIENEVTNIHTMKRPCIKDGGKEPTIVKKSIAKIKKATKLAYIGKKIAN